MTELLPMLSLCSRALRHWNRHDFHVVVRVRSEASTARHIVVIEHAKRTKVHLLRIVPSSKAETVVGVQPTVVGMAALRSTVKHELDFSIGSAVHGVWVFWNQEKDGHHRGLREKGESGKRTS